MKMKSRWQAGLLAVSTVVAVLPASAAAKQLCPRGEYSFVKSAGAGNQLSASVTLPTAGYQVALVVGKERIHPQQVRFYCTTPDGMVAQVLTTYQASASVPSEQIRVIDAGGSVVLKAGAPAGTDAAGGAAGNK